jgi:hypothetical protein
VTQVLNVPPRFACTHIKAPETTFSLQKSGLIFKVHRNQGALKLLKFALKQLRLYTAKIFNNYKTHTSCQSKQKDNPRKMVSPACCDPFITVLRVHTWSPGLVQINQVNIIYLADTQASV